MRRIPNIHNGYFKEEIINTSEIFTAVIAGESVDFSAENYTWQIRGIGSIGSDTCTIVLQSSIDDGDSWIDLDTKDETDLSSSPTPIPIPVVGIIYRFNCTAITLDTLTGIKATVAAK